MPTVAEQVDKLDTLKGKLSTGDRRFANNLISGPYGYRTRVGKGQTSRFSQKQVACVEKLIERAENPIPVKTAEVGSMAGLIAIFKKAAVHLKYPKISLGLDENTPVVFALAGSRSQAPGSVNVTDGKPFGQNKWYGRVSPEGTWEIGRSPHEELPQVGELLEKMSNDPAATAAEYGRLTGNCCFCNRKLKDERSTNVGYGRTCAGHYGLPWGS
jgi:hypothetical protein